MMSSPEMSMILEKARAMCDERESAALGLLLDEYLIGGIFVEEFVGGLSKLVARGEKVSVGVQDVDFLYWPTFVTFLFVFLKQTIRSCQRRIKLGGKYVKGYRRSMLLPT